MASFFLPFILLGLSLAASVLSNQTYIVYMNPAHRPSVHPTAADWYTAELQSLSIDPSNRLLYAYKSAAHGFAVRLDQAHVSLLQDHRSVLQIVPDPVLSLHTTRSPSFLGLLPTSVPLQSVETASSDVIIGVLDTGVWPESPSFSAGSSLPPIPKRWRGACEAGVDFPPSFCNRKLIGARSFSRGFHAAGGTRPAGEYSSPRDQDGHGTHTASTAAGLSVGNASLLGYATGTARGMATGARVAVYKVCWSSGCLGSDILAGIDAAVSDGVDVLSLSLGGGAAPYFRDTIAIGTFGAAEHGVFVSCSAGNSGPGASSVANSAPWITTVGAGTLDRDFPAYASLGSGEHLTGVSLYSGPSMGSKLVPIIYGSNKNNASKLCLAGTLDQVQVKGKFVLCDRGVNARVEKGAVVKAAGGAGMILANTAASGEELVADSHLLPAVAVGRKAGDVIRNYVIKNKNAKGVISFGGTVLGIRPSPVVAAFSSRGPNVVVLQILKPDLIGPGVNILAAWSGAAGPTGLVKDDRRTQFNIVSGTSMSCPHISGVAALLKAAHPDWSPAAIKSALMTTSYTSDNTNSPLLDAAGGQIANAYAYGSGYVDPQKALSPGLVYDLTTNDYIAFLCSLGYSSQHIQVITRRNEVSCANKLSDPGNLNYPSFSVVFGKKRVVKYTREVTNVGLAGSVYGVKVTGPEFVGVTVKPTKLVFKRAGQKAKYSVTFISKNKANITNDAFGWISWVNSQQTVRSPVAYSWKISRTLD
ncbi:Subtilisin-like protease SBT1.7 [Rhynchospora pubera]|uniref:Subtilisin-like protease SBT1.7 n=1 Tax=Rhynchospora pubera TaxID=906938 RepID=A0AAV8C4M4_9POAL|nr:Subtilisin-like protease SBT1.7 [Rhynchospora pubera]